jgi:Xaa-Pro aminopeptidase
MRQTFDESTDPGFGPRHDPLIRAAKARQVVE